jgi:hypothetical protein
MTVNTSAGIWSIRCIVHSNHATRSSSKLSPMMSRLNSSCSSRVPIFASLSAGISLPVINSTSISPHLYNSIQHITTYFGPLELSPAMHQHIRSMDPPSTNGMPLSYTSMPDRVALSSGNVFLDNTLLEIHIHLRAHFCNLTNHRNHSNQNMLPYRTIL